MMVIRVDNRAAAVEIRNHGDTSRFEPELPWLGVVAGGRLDGTGNQSPQAHRRGVDHAVDPSVSTRSGMTHRACRHCPEPSQIVAAT